MTKGWKHESLRHSNAKKFGVAGGKYADKREKALMRKRNKLTAPLSNQSTHLPIQVAIVVPSTKEKSKPLTDTGFKKRVETTAKEFSERFGGDTSIKGKGDYTSNGKLIREDVVVVESSMTKKDYLKNKKEIENFIKEKQKNWGQESIGYRFEDDFYIYPKFD